MITTDNKNSEAYRRDMLARALVMYALRLSNEIFHLTQRGRQHTLCGLRISRATSAQSRGLALANELSAEEKVCKHCNRIKEQDLGDNL